MHLKNWHASQKIISLFVSLSIIIYRARSTWDTANDNRITEDKEAFEWRRKKLFNKKLATSIEIHEISNIVFTIYPGNTVGILRYVRALHRLELSSITRIDR